MAVVYRLVRPDEQDTVLHMWGDASYQAARLATDPAPSTHTWIAVAPDGTILSVLHYLVTLRRDIYGRPQQVGMIDSVVTRPEARRQGHAGRLVVLAQDALQTDGSDWALLVATDEGRPLYERYGWQCYGEPWRRGTLTGAVPQADSRYVVRPYDPLEDPRRWDQIAAVDLAFNRTRPLTVIRDTQYWHTYAAWRISNWIKDEGLVIFGAFRGEADPRLCGFAFAEFYHLGFQVRDIGVLPEEADAALPLLTAVAAEAGARGLPLAGRMYLPHEPAIDAALERLFGPTLHAGKNVGHLMARTIGADCTAEHLDTLFNAPAAHFSTIDLF